MALALPQINLLPKLESALNALIQITGLQTVADLGKRVGDLKAASTLVASELNALKSDVLNFIGNYGAVIPGSSISQVFEGINGAFAEFDQVVAAVLSGQPQTITDVDYTAADGISYDLELILRAKVKPVPVEPAPAA